MVTSGKKMGQKLEHLTSSGLRALIAELRPLEVCDLVEREHQVLAARQLLESLSERLRHAKTEARAAHWQLCNWRLSHPLQTRLHYWGWMPSLPPFMMHKFRRERKTQDLRLAETDRTSAGTSLWVVLMDGRNHCAGSMGGTRLGHGVKGSRNAPLTSGCRGPLP